MAKKSPAPVSVALPTNLTNGFYNIFKAHRATNRAILLWGSSGYGKTSMIEHYARSEGMKLLTVRSSYVDPLSMFIPQQDKLDDNGAFTNVFADWIQEIRFTNQPTVLFLDEFTRPASPQTYPLFMELACERKFMGHPISKHVQIIAATNFAEEDGGTTDLPEAAWLRFTHLTHAPSEGEMVSNMRSKLARDTLTANPRLARSPGTFTFDRLKFCPRQADVVAEMYELDLIDDNEVGVVARGVMGEADGNQFATAMRQVKNEKKSIFPSKVNNSTFQKFMDLEAQGKTNEVVLYLVNHSDKENVARYFSFYASPEATLQAVTLNFMYMFEDVPVDMNGVPPQNHKEQYEWTNPIKDGKVIPVPWVFIASFLDRVVFTEEARIQAEEAANLKKA
jgi:hypothetical protein